MHREKINALRITKNIRKESHFKIKYFEHEMHENKLKIIKIKKKYLLTNNQKQHRNDEK